MAGTVDYRRAYFLETAAREFQIMVKTIGPICIDCHYCYYLKKEKLYPKDSNFRLNDETLERYIIQHIQATPEETVSFSWHGGEPTLLGVEFFRKAVELQKKHLAGGQKNHQWHSDQRHNHGR